jgi:hypothetical protein
MSKIKILMILTTRIASVIHVVSSKIHTIGGRYSQGYSLCSQVLVRLLTKYDIPYLLLQLVSQDSVQELFYHIKTFPYPVVSRSEFHVLCLRIRFVSQGVVGVRSVDLGISWTFSVIFFNDSRGCTLLISAYISFA